MKSELWPVIKGKLNVNLEEDICSGITAICGQKGKSYPELIQPRNDRGKDGRERAA